MATADQYDREAQARAKNIAVTGYKAGSGGPRRGGGGSFDKPRKQVPTKRPVPKNPAPPVPVPVGGGGTRRSGGRGGGSSVGPFSTSPIGGGGGAGAVGGIGAAAPTTPPLTEDQYIAADAPYLAQKSALDKLLADFLAKDTADRSMYETNYGKAVDNLGYRQPVVDDPATEANETFAGGFNFEDQNKASGRAYQNQLNDFSGRGLLQSTLYAKALDGLKRSLNEQLGGINTAKTNFMTDKDQAKSTYQIDNSNQALQARADAAARYASIYKSL